MTIAIEVATRVADPTGMIYGLGIVIGAVLLILLGVLIGTSIRK